MIKIVSDMGTHVILKITLEKLGNLYCNTGLFTCEIAKTIYLLFSKRTLDR